MMSMISSRSELLERIEDLLAVEIKARDGYEQDVHTFKNFEITTRIARIRDDEDRHIAMLKQLVGMLKQPYASSAADNGKKL